MNEWSLNRPIVVAGVEWTPPEHFTSQLVTPLADYYICRARTEHRTKRLQEVVSVIILFTYMRIVMETRKMRQDRASVSKAMHTVLLHGFQLLLCLLAFTQPISETLIGLHTNWPAEDVAFFNFFCFILIPRFLSPLIYGFRDQNQSHRVAGVARCERVNSGDVPQRKASSRSQIRTESSDEEP
ncbi:hypothetical protein CCH79_00010270 [Gambusia affinis]|uniref:G-protein coupled receptors family 1 profile domain-containing protein n=1 Tax=Gambusia affinis TaxID=33528 RepID=A0A315VGV2_GAMAF|nr:hypothetical protein CCH79_00010270 [Gambusia affinis]